MRVVITHGTDGSFKCLNALIQVSGLRNAGGEQQK